MNAPHAKPIVVVKASYGFKADGRYEATATFDGKTYRATAASSARALTTVARKIKNAFPEVTHLEANGLRLALAEGAR